MEKKKDFTIEELKKQRDEAEQNFKTLNEQLNQAIQEEEDRKKAELALKKEARTKEVDDAIKHVDDLFNEYVKDYGSYSGKYKLDDYGIFSKHPFSWWF